MLFVYEKFERLSTFISFAYLHSCVQYNSCECKRDCFSVNYSVVNAVNLIVYKTLGREGLRLRQGPIDPPSCCELLHTYF